MIELPKGLILIADERCYIVGKPKKERGRGVEIQNPKYYPTMESAIRGALSLVLLLKVRGEEITTLQQFLDEQARLNQELWEMITHGKCGGKPVKASGDGIEITTEGSYISQFSKSHPTDGKKEV